MSNHGVGYCRTLALLNPCDFLVFRESFGAIRTVLVGSPDQKPDDALLGNGVQNAVLAIYFCFVFVTGGAKSSVCGRRIHALNRHHVAAQVHPLVELRVELRTISTLSATDAQMLRTWRSR